jgi:Rad3-related DNA helicase
MTSEHQLESSDGNGDSPPWSEDLCSVSFVTIECDGDDPEQQGLLGVAALRIDRDGEKSWSSTDGEKAAWQDLEEFCSGSLFIVPDARQFRDWSRTLGGTQFASRPVIGLGEVGSLLLPGRLAAQPEELLLALCADEAPAAAVQPADLRRALSRLLRKFLGQDADVIHAVSVGLATAWARLCVTEPVGAHSIGQALQLLQSAPLWIEEAAGQEAIQPLRFESDPLEADFLHLVLESAEPRWTSEAKDWHKVDPVPPNRERALPWAPEDEALLESSFRTHLPAVFSEEHGVPGVYRESQHAVSKQVSANFGRSLEAETQLLLVHAPTGTGKTLAYMIPAMLWSKRHNVRVGIATYTRALQEQAIDREVPRALEVLRRAGLIEKPRVSMLKGRENYLCWRTLKLHIPPFESSGEQWLAYCQLLAFSLSDSSGDLDRLPRRSPLELGHNETYRNTLNDLLRQVRARTSCCRAKEDKVTCGAEVARWRAERSHVVVTNHSFALARQEFFRHLVFDECEHLHEQAHSAWSHSVGMGSLSSWLNKLYNPDEPRSRSLFRRVDKRIVAGSPSWETLQQCRERHEALGAVFVELEKDARDFDKWRSGRVREGDVREDHNLLREYVESPRGNNLISRRINFAQVGNQLDEKLAELNARLETLGKGRMARLRRSLDLARTDLDEFLTGLVAWLPIQEGKPTFNKRTFNDIEVDPKAGLVLSARVLLPNEYLGRFYYPQLATASFLSATTHMQGGFDAASSYLGLDRAVETREDDPDLVCALHTFRAPEVFDYSRVLIAVPRDAPSVSREKDAFLRYTRDFIADLAEETRGRMLVLFTNADDVRQVGARLEGHFRARRIGFWYQNMPGSSKEELGELFRRRVDSVMLGVDTFWYGADFPGETLEHLVIVRLPYGVPDRYHHAQCASLGISEQRRQIYMPRALAKFRQGFGRLMRRVSDRGCIYVLDHRIVDPRHRSFLKELPVARIGEDPDGLARMVRGETERCKHQALLHMGLREAPAGLPVEPDNAAKIERFEPNHESLPPCDPMTIEVDTEDLPF